MKEYRDATMTVSRGAATIEIRAPRSILLTPTEQHRRFVEAARELGISDTEAAQERAFGKVGLKKPRKGKRKK
jgi:hypothetical protein